MNRFEVDRTALLGPGILLLAVTLLAAALVWFSAGIRDGQAQLLNDARASYQANLAEYRRAVEAGRIIETSGDRYRRLEQFGFVGEEPRLFWIESLRAAGEQSRLYELQYSLKPRVAVELADMGYTENYQLYTSSMSLQMELAHEVDLLRFFDQLSANRSALYQLRSCSLSSASKGEGINLDQPNVNASCDLAWYTVNRHGEPGEEELL